MGVTRKEVVFDLDTTEKGLQTYYSNPANWRKAYDDIRNFMQQHGFEHQQGSAYISDNPLKKQEVYDLVSDMVKNMPWLSQCTKALDIANIGNKISYLDEIRNISQKDNVPDKLIQSEAQKKKTETANFFCRNCL